MAVQIAVSTYSLWRWRAENKKSLENSLKWIADQGVLGVEFAGFEVPAGHTFVSRAKELRKCCDDLGLKVPSYCTGAEFLVEPAKQAQVVSQLKEEIDAAVILGARTMRHDVSRGPEGTPWAGKCDEEVIAALAGAVREVSQYAKKVGLRSSLENHGFYFQTADRIEKLLDAVKEPNMGVTLDMGNFLCLNQDPVEAVRRLMKYAVMVHTKDFHKMEKKEPLPAGWFATPTPIALRGAVLGEGVVDIPAQMKILKEHHYNGWISLEFEGTEEPAAGVKAGLAYLKEQLAKAGL